jgi:hypothetical protein
MAWELTGAIMAAAAVQRAGDGLGALTPDLSWPSLPGLPALPELPAFPDLSGLDPRPALHRGVDHALGLFGLRPSGLWVPATPTVRRSPVHLLRSGPDAGRPLPAPSARGWAGAIDPDGLVRFLRAQHPFKPALHVSLLTGESEETVRKWLKRETRPGFRATLVLVCVYGPELLEAALTREAGARRPVWLDEIRRGHDRLRLAAELAALGPRIDAALELAR